MRRLRLRWYYQPSLKAIALPVAIWLAYRAITGATTLWDLLWATPVLALAIDYLLSHGRPWAELGESGLRIHRRKPGVIDEVQFVNVRGWHYDSNGILHVVNQYGEKTQVSLLILSAVAVSEVLAALAAFAPVFSVAEPDGKASSERRDPEYPWRSHLRRLLFSAMFFIAPLLFFGTEVGPWILISTGDILLDKGRLEEARLNYERALEVSIPPYPAAHERIGYLLAAQGLYEEAIASYCQGLKWEPDDAWSYYNLGIALSRLGKREHARVCYRRGIRGWPDRFAPSQALNQGDLDILDMAFPDEWKIWEACGPGTLEAPIIGLTNVMEARNSFAKAHKQIVAAEARFRKAIQLDPADFLAYNSLGIAVHAQARLDEAEESYLLAIHLNPGYAPAYNNLGSVLKAKGHLDSAEVSYRQAIVLDPNLDAATQNLETLKRFREQKTTWISKWFVTGH